MNTVYLAKELDYNHDVTLGAYETFDEAKEAIHSYYNNLVETDCVNDYVEY